MHLVEGSRMFYFELYMLDGHIVLTFTTAIGTSHCCVKKQNIMKHTVKRPSFMFFFIQVFHIFNPMSHLQGLKLPPDPQRQKYTCFPNKMCAFSVPLCLLYIQNLSAVTQFLTYKHIVILLRLHTSETLHIKHLPPMRQILLPV